MSEALSFEQIRVGQTWTSPKRTVTETDVVNFANITGDHNPLHIDHEFAAKSPYRQPIAHGLLGIAWVAGLGSNSPRVQTVAFVGVRNWEFVKPIFYGDTVHVETEVIEKEITSRKRGTVRWIHKLYNQHGETVQHGEFETLVTIADPVPAAHFKPLAIKNDVVNDRHQ